ncbi:MAG TPA: hypothetical protein VHT24_15350 [Pseudacidobacterium sp.]|jgi:type VI protein secretion system component VasF|nr:hypothetical protein [Pseudacidobacterium sp.]
MQRFDANSGWRKLLLLGLFLAGSFVIAHAQLQTPPPSRPLPTSPGQAPTASDENDNDPLAHRSMVEQAKRRNNQRQQDLVNDTNKLLQLAQQLKTEVDKSNKDELSLNVVKKAEEIEKLAKSVKEKMKGS